MVADLKAIAAVMFYLPLKPTAENM